MFPILLKTRYGILRAFTTEEEMSTIGNLVEDFYDEVERLSMFIRICQEGLAVGAQAVESIDLRRRVAGALKRPDPFSSKEDYQDEKKVAAKVEVFARHEVEAGHPYLSGLTIVKMWSLLESLVDDIALQRLGHPQRLLESPVVRDLKGPLVEFLTADSDRQAEMLLNKYRDAVKASLKPGVGRFEAMLDPLGLGGPVDQNVRRALLELAEIRNLLVHRRGVVDTRFTGRCEWLSVEVGEELPLPSARVADFRIAMFWYGTELYCRWRRRDNPELDSDEVPIEDMEKLRSFFLDELRKGEERDG